MRSIYVDLDDTVVDLRGGVYARLGFPPDFAWPKGVWLFSEGFGMPDSDIWPRLNDHEFWAGLAKTKECDELMRLAAELVGSARVRILTKPTLSPYSASGKVAWLQKHLPAYARQYHLSVTKEELAAPHRVLVDDSDENVNAWRAHGGRAVLVPRPWNSRHGDDPSTLFTELIAVVES